MATFCDAISSIKQMFRDVFSVGAVLETHDWHSKKYSQANLRCKVSDDDIQGKATLTTKDTAAESNMLRCTFL
jgi:hypothetical protein